MDAVVKNNINIYYPEILFIQVVNVDHLAYHVHDNFLANLHRLGY